MRVPIIVLILSSVFNFAAAQERLRVHGSNTIGERLAPELAAAWLVAEGFSELRRVDIAFEEVEIHGLRDGVTRTVEIHAHGSSTGFKDMAEGDADIAMSSRPASAADSSANAAIDSTLGQLDSSEQEVVLALDGLAIVVHPSNPLRELSRAQLQGIFSGRLTDWSTLGGRAGRIALHARDEKSGTWESFRTLVLGAVPLSAQVQRYESTAQLADAVAADSLAIGFVGLSGVKGVRALSISDSGSAVPPSREEVAVEDYPLSRRLYLYLPPQPSALARAFIDFALSQPGQSLVENVGFVSQNIRAYAGTPRSDAPAEYQSLIKGARRLSLNFRFGSGAAFLDSKALRDLDRLAAFMRQPAQRGQPLLLLGFSDADEAVPILAVFLSNERVDYVANRLNERGIDPARSRGMGGTVPVAANDSAHGKQRNRRVEVWLGPASESRRGSPSTSRVAGK